MAQEGYTDVATVEAAPEDDHLQRISDGIMSQIPEDLQDDLERVVVSAQQIMYSKTTHKQIMDGMRDIDDPNDARKVALGVAAILTIINREAGEKIPVELMIPAGCLVTVEVIRWLIDAEMVESDTEFTGNAIEELLAALMQKMGMGKSKAPQEPPPQQGPQDNRIPAETVVRGDQAAAPVRQGLIGAPA